MDDVTGYIREKYRPLALIVYGSYADGSNNEHSDFDALAICGGEAACHDTGFVGGVQLDLFVYPRSHFQDGFDPEEILQVSDGVIIFDTDGIVAGLVSQVRDYITALPRKSLEELEASVAWCEKMLLRTQRGDTEGLFRLHWLMTDSLQMFCDIMCQLYRGPKKALRWMEAQEPEAFALYDKALREPNALTAWIRFLRAALDKR